MGYHKIKQKTFMVWLIFVVQAPAGLSRLFGASCKSIRSQHFRIENLEATSEQERPNSYIMPTFRNLYYF